MSTYVALSESKNGIFDVKSANSISNVSQVGLVEFACDVSKLSYTDLTRDEKRAHFEYNVLKDNISDFSDKKIKITDVLSKIQKADGFDRDPFAYSSLKYELNDEDLPMATGLMYQHGGDSTHDVEIFNFMELFQIPFATKKNLKSKYPTQIGMINCQKSSILRHCSLRK